MDKYKISQIVKQPLNIFKDWWHALENKEQHLEKILKGAVLADHPELLTVLLSHDSNMHQDMFYLAIKHGRMHTIEFFLSHNLVAYNQRINEQTYESINIAISRKNDALYQPILSMLLHHLAQISQDRVKLAIYQAAVCASTNNIIHGIKYIYQKEKLQAYANDTIDYDYIDAINVNNAAITGNLKLLKMLVKNHVAENYDYSEAFFNACAHNQINIVRYLLLDKKVNIHSNNEKGLSMACKNGHTKIIDYLLSSSELKEHANPFNEMVFYEACMAIPHERSTVMEKLIFYYNIQLTKKIKGYLEKNKEKDILEMFAIRELKQSLERHLGLTHSEIVQHNELPRSKI